MAPGKTDDDDEHARESTIILIHDHKNHSKHEKGHRPTRRRTPSLTALMIIAIASALLLAAVIVIGATNCQSSTEDTPPDNASTPIQSGSRPSPSAATPPGGDRGLSWCQVQGDGNCTLGVHQNLETGQIRAQVFDQNCRPLGSSDHIRVDTVTAVNTSLPGTVVLLVHGVTGPTDEVWYNDTHYLDGWIWQNPTPVWYETQAFPCL